MADTERPSPSYDRPPVSEVALAVVFEPLAGWDITHYGRLFTELRQEYPAFQSQHPVPPQVENFDDTFMHVSPAFVQVMTTAPVRGLYGSADGSRLVQVQNDYFVVNWRRQQPDDAYPRYEAALRPFFAREWDRFQAYLAANGLARPTVQQCEVVYVNDLVQGEAWHTMADLGDVFAPWSGRQTDGFLPPPETVNVSASYRLPGNRGRLRMDLRHVRRMTDAQEVLQLQMTAKARPAGGATTDVLECLDLVRRWIVHGFSDVTARRIQEEVWGRQQ